jgi:hypothetical protein
LIIHVVLLLCRFAVTPQVFSDGGALPGAVGQVTLITSVSAAVMSSTMMLHDSLADHKSPMYIYTLTSSSG